MEAKKYIIIIFSIISLILIVMDLYNYITLPGYSKIIIGLVACFIFFDVFYFSKKKKH